MIFSSDSALGSLLKVISAWHVWGFDCCSSVDVVDPSAFDLTPCLYQCCHSVLKMENKYNNKYDHSLWSWFQTRISNFTQAEQGFIFISLLFRAHFANLMSFQFGAYRKPPLRNFEKSSSIGRKMIIMFALFFGCCCTVLAAG